MAEWLVEQGIGEERAILYDRGQALAARLSWPGELAAGEVAEGVLVSKPKNARRGRARFASGEEALVDRLPKDASEGRSMRFEVTRSAIGEAARRKLAQARPTQDAVRPAPTLAETLGARVVHRFADGLWEELWQDAAEGIVDFPNGALQFSPTPAMTLVDVDGTLPPRDLALKAVEPLARAIALFGISGSVGVDFPTLQAKDDRKAVDGLLGAHLAEWDHERTAMNGFGFVQLVARAEAPSLLHRIAFDRAGATARLLLRRAEGLEGAGSIEITANPAVLARIADGWLDELKRRSGRDVVTRAEPGLAIAAGHAQLVTR